MAEIEETRLPGVGIRHEFVTENGERIGILSHFSGRRELLLFDRNDPDSCSTVVNLEEPDARVLAELLGTSHVAEQLANLKQSVHGLTIDWLPIPADAAYAGKTIGDSQMRRRTGVSIVAVLRDDHTMPSPTPDFRIEAGDTAVVVGTPEGIKQALALLHRDE